MIHYDRRKRQRSRILLLILLVLLVTFAGIWAWKHFSTKPEDAVGKISGIPSISPSADLAVPAVSGKPGTTGPLPQRVQATPAQDVGKKGISLGSNVNVRADHSVGSTVVTKLSQGEHIDILETWMPETASEAVAIMDFDAQIRGKTVRILKGRGVIVVSCDEGGTRYSVRLPQDSAKTVFQVPSGNLSKPLDWQWYKIRDGRNVIGWVFGKYIEPLAESGERNTTLSSVVRDALSTFGGTRDAVEAVLGTPRKTVTSKSGEQIVLRYDGLSVTVNGSGRNARVTVIEVSSAARGLKGGLVPGMNREKARLILGKPSKEDKRSETFLSGHGEGIVIRIGKGDTIDAIRVGKL